LPAMDPSVPTAGEAVNLDSRTTRRAGARCPSTPLDFPFNFR
jgi:hypothetical protein